MSRPDAHGLNLSHPIPVAATPPTEPAMPPSTPKYVRAFCGKLAAEHPDPLAQHPHVCLQPRGHVADGIPHACPSPCGHQWYDIVPADQALLTALADQLNELRLAGLTIQNVRVMLGDQDYVFGEDKRRFRIEGDLVPAEEG